MMMREREGEREGERERERERERESLRERERERESSVRNVRQAQFREESDVDFDKREMLRTTGPGTHFNSR